MRAALTLCLSSAHHLHKSLLALKPPAHLGLCTAFQLLLGSAIEFCDQPSTLSFPVSLSYEEQPPLPVPIIAFDGTGDFTIPRGYMAQWCRYTSERFRRVSIAGDHYFVSTHFREVRRRPPSVAPCRRQNGCLLSPQHQTFLLHLWPTLRTQVTAEVGREALALVDARRLGGGLLGAGHSWVAGPSEGPPTTTRSSSSNSGSSSATAQQQERRRHGAAGPGRASELGWALYNRWEDVRELLSSEVQLTASGRTMALALASALAASTFLALRWGAAGGGSRGGAS